MKASIGAPNWAYLSMDKPGIDQAKLDSLLDGNGDPTAASNDYIEKVKRKEVYLNNVEALTIL
jgi:hypothetical protein